MSFENDKKQKLKQNYERFFFLNYESKILGGK